MPASARQNPAASGTPHLRGGLFSLIFCFLLLPACATVTTIEPAGERPPPIAAFTTSDGTLPWPDRLAIQPGLTQPTLDGLKRTSGRPWSPMGTIIPLEVPVQSIRITTAAEADGPGSFTKDFENRILPALRQSRGLDPAIEVVRERPGAFIVRPVDAADRRDVPTPRAGRANLAFQFVSLRPQAFAEALERPGVRVTRAQLDRTAFFYYDPAQGWQDDGTPIGPLSPKGLVVVLPGMFGTPGDQITELVKQLRQRGYAVLRMMAHPARFTESTSFAVPLEGDIAPMARHIGADLSDRAAECAYAVEAAIAYVHEQRPALIAVPRAAIGMSGGAMVMPAVVARDPGAWNALVFIGGGVDYLRILTTSNYTDWINALKVAWVTPPEPNTLLRAAMRSETGSIVLATFDAPPGTDESTLPGQAVGSIENEGKRQALRAIITGPLSVAEASALYGDLDATPPKARSEALYAAYRQAAPLDSANLAPLLRSTPALLIQATTDRAVPSATGDELWERLGRPERWLVSGGHEWLFFTLNSKLPRISDWLDASLASRSTPKSGDNLR